MYRAIALIEVMITLSILVIALFFLSPILFKWNDEVIVGNEINLVKSFLYQIQEIARYNNQNYILTISQDEKAWCIIALVKKERKTTDCNCLYLNRCLLNGQDYRIYRNQYPTAIYSNAKINFSPISREQSSGCLSLSKDKISKIIQFQRNGMLNVITTKDRTQCK